MTKLRTSTEVSVAPYPVADGFTFIRERNKLVECRALWGRLYISVLASFPGLRVGHSNEAISVHAQEGDGHNYSVGGGRTIVGVANSKNTNVIVVCCIFYKNKLQVQALYYRD